MLAGSFHALHACQVGMSLSRYTEHLTIIAATILDSLTEYPLRLWVAS